MRRLVLYILLLTFGLQSQQTTVNGQQTLFFMSTDNSQQTTDIFHRSKTKSCTSDAYSRTVDCCPLSVDFYESQIRMADSLYKNYLPQSNFEEVKAAMEFFDSVEVHTQNVQGEYGVNVIELQQIPVGIYIDN